MGYNDGYAPAFDVSTPRGRVEAARAAMLVQGQFDEMDAMRALDPAWYDAAVDALAAEKDAWKDAYITAHGVRVPYPPPPELAAIIDRHEKAIREHFAHLS